MKEMILWMVLQGVPAQTAAPSESPGAVDAETTVGTTQSASGRWHVMVRSSAVPLKRGPQRFTVRVTDSATGKPMRKGTLRVEPWMPSMGHGLSETPRVTPRGEGVFEVSDLDLFMPGTWELRFTLEGPEPDTAKLTLKLGR